MKEDKIKQLAQLLIELGIDSIGTLSSRNNRIKKDYNAIQFFSKGKKILLFKTEEF